MSSNNDNNSTAVTQNKRKISSDSMFKEVRAKSPNVVCKAIIFVVRHIYYNSNVLFCHST